MRRTGVWGHKEAARNLRELGRFVSAPAGESARYALRPMLTAARQNAPRVSGNLRKSLAIVRDPTAPKSRPVFYVGPRRGTRGSRIIHLTEFHNTTSQGWFTAAWESVKATVLQRYGEKLGPAIEARARKLGRSL